MLLIAFRDLQFRLRRFMISVLAVALVLGLTLLLSGVAASFDAEAENMLDLVGIDSWVVPAGASGPFFGAVPMAADQVEKVRALDGVEEAAGQGMFGMTIDDPDGPIPVTLLGVEPGLVGSPTPHEGDALSDDGQVVVDTGLGLDVGDVLQLGGEDLVVTGTLDRSTLLSGTPNLFVTISDLQKLAYNGAPVITSVAVKGNLNDPGEGLEIVSRDGAHEDVVRPLAPAKETIVLISVLLWIVTGCIIGSVIYLSAIERIGDFAVYKATGVATTWILGGLILQAALLSLVSSALAIVLAWLLVPTMSVPVVLPPNLVLLVPLMAMTVSIVGSLAGVRRAVRVDPALAFG